MSRGSTHARGALSHGKSHLDQEVCPWPTISSMRTRSVGSRLGSDLGQTRGSGAERGHREREILALKQHQRRQEYSGRAMREEVDVSETTDAAFAAGMQVRREMFGPGGAEERYAQATDFNRPFEDMVTRYCFGDTWTRPGLDRKTRSLITLAALTALSKPNQLKVHVAGALVNGCSVEEIRETILHTAVYAGVPCGVEAFNAAAETLARQPESKR